MGWGLGFVVGFGLFHNGFWWISVCFVVALMGSGVGWVSDGGGGLGIMLMVVICVVIFG